MKKLLLGLIIATSAATSFGYTSFMSNVGWTPNLGAGNNDLGCLSSSAYASTSTSCPTKNTFVQGVFNANLNAINSVIVDEKAAISTKGISQPSSVISGWSTMDNKTRAQKLADYGFNFQNTTLKSFLTNICKNGDCKSVFVAPKKKDVDRVLEKSPTDGAAGNLDYSRATIVANYAEISNILGDIAGAAKKSGAQKLVVVKNRLMYPTGTLYRDVQVLLKDSQTGFISELLILGPLMAQEKNSTSHTLYESIRAAEAEIDAIRLDVENNKKSLSTSDQAQITALQNTIDSNKAKTNQLHDYIFRTDALTSCGEVGSSDYNKCKTELSPYINKPNF
jgi:hypothetical protein